MSSSKRVAVSENDKETNILAFAKDVAERDRNEKAENTGETGNSKNHHRHRSKGEHASHFVGLGLSNNLDSDAIELKAARSDKVLRLDIRQVEASTFIIVDEVTNRASPGYCLVNKSVSHYIHYRQKDVRGSNWQSLAPGGVVSYTWEDPFISRKLLVQAGRNVLSPMRKSQDDNNFPGLNPHLIGRSAPTLKQHNEGDSKLKECTRECIPGLGQTIDRYTTIHLDDVDATTHDIRLPNNAEGSLIGEIQINGTIKVLTIRPNYDDLSNGPSIGMRAAVTRELLYCHLFCEKQRVFVAKAYQELRASLKMASEINSSHYNEASTSYLQPKDSELVSSLPHEVVNDHVTGYPTRGVDHIDAALMSVDGLLDELQELQEDVLGIIESMDIALFATSNQPKKRGTLESSATGMAKDSQVWGLATDHDQHGDSVRDETNGGYNQESEMMPQKSPAMEDFRGNSILSYLPLCSPTGECITHTNQLQVEILSAKELQPLATSKMEDTFCEVEVMNLRALAVNAFESELGLNINVNRGLTYICEKNMNPNWIGQNFIFDVPENAVREKREYKVRVTMRAVSSDSLVQPFDRILGHAEIHFSSLMNEEPVYGWFPLRPHKASITNVENFQTCGSIKLRLRWIHSKTGLARYIAGRLQARLHELHVQQQAQAVMMMEVFTGKGQSMPKTMALQQSGKDSLKEEQAYTDSINTAHSVFATAGLGTSSGIARHGPDEIIPRSGPWMTWRHPQFTENSHSLLSPTFRPLNH